MRVEFFKHNIEDEERERVLEVLKGNFITTGSICEEFETMLANYLGVKYVILVSSCTAGLHLALLALGIGKGDKVAIPAFTFVATANVVLYTGAVPVLIDSDPETGLMDLNKLEYVLKRERISAIIPVHLYGQMIDMKSLLMLAERYNCYIIEDAAHSLEAVRDGIKPGNLSNAACFSFYATKNITCGEGGAIAVNEPQLANRLKLLRLHGMDKTGADRYRKGPGDWDVITLGYKYNLTDFQAAMLIPQLRRIEQSWYRRYEIYKLYRKHLSGISGIRLPQQKFQLAKTSTADNTQWYTRSALHLFVIWLKDKDIRDKLLSFLHSNSIGVTINWPRAIHMFSYYKQRFGYKDDDYPIAKQIAETSISLPFYPKLKQEEIEYVINTIKVFFKKEI